MSLILTDMKNILLGFSKPFKSYLLYHTIYNFISSMIKKIKHCSDVIKKHFNKELVMTKEDNKDFKNLLNVRSMIMIILMVMLK